MKNLIITDLSRFTNPAIVCIALVDPESGVCYRPLPYLTSSQCKALNIQPGTIISGDVSLKPDNVKPHIEDANCEGLKFVGTSSADEFKNVLLQTLSPGASAGFGVQFENGQKFIPHDTPPATCSIITLKIEPAKLAIFEDRYKPGKIKLSFTDSDGHRLQYLSITDRGFYDFAMTHQHDSELGKVQKLIHKQEEIYIRLGLSRCFEAPDGRKGYWLQINGLYSFPDYLKELRHY